MERWASIIGWEGLYEVSDLGNVRQIGRGKRRVAGQVLRPHLRPDGYKSVILSERKKGRRHQMLVHRLVAAAFLGPCPVGFYVDHIDGVRSNEAAVNLEYVTVSVNIARAYARTRALEQVPGHPAAGLFSREKGKRFERYIATDLREHFPEFAEQIHRSIQSRGPEGSDVLGIPSVWVECEDSVSPDPFEKLTQAIRDCPEDQIPVAVTHRTKTPMYSIRTTLRLGDLTRFITAAAYQGDRNAGEIAYRLAHVCSTTPVTLLWSDFKKLLRAAEPWTEEFRQHYLT